jgi:hypothetical protein
MKKYWWIILIIVIAIGFFLWKKSQAKSPAQQPAKNPPPQRGKVTMDLLKARRAQKDEEGDVFPLKVGSRGEEVRILQKMLNSKFGAMLTPHGNFDNATEAALARAGYKKEVDKTDFNLIQTMSLAQARKLRKK